MDDKWWEDLLQDLDQEIIGTSPNSAPPGWDRPGMWDQLLRGGE
jgi:hypothetical protein